MGLCDRQLSEFGEDGLGKTRGVDMKRMALYAPIAVGHHETLKLVEQRLVRRRIEKWATLVVEA